MFSNFERMVAFRYLRPGRGETYTFLVSIFSFLGIAFGVFTLIVVMSVMGGFREELLSRILGLQPHLSISNSKGPIQNYFPIIAALETNPMVIAAFPLIQEQVLTRNQGKVSGAVVQGMRYEDLINRSTISDSISRTSKAAYSLDQGIIIGSHLAGVLGTRVGDKIQLVSPSSTATVVGNVPRARTYRVIGIFNVDMYEYDRSFIFMPLKLAQLHFKYGRNVSDVQIRIKNPDEATALRLDFTEMLGSQFKVHDWKQRNSTYFGVLEVEKNVMFVILLLIILVAAFNIISSMIMVVRSKYRQIAILRTIGVSSGQIMRIFFINGALLGLCGTLLGTVCGILFAIYIEPIRSFVENVIGTKLFPSEIYFLSKLPTRIDATEVIVICVLALLISFAATIYPAWKASRVDPIEAFRNE